MGAPSGTVTFLFTDIVGSTRLWEEMADAMRVALARHDVIVRAALDAHGGFVFSTGGDGFAAAFARAADGLVAAGDAQAALAAEAWPDGAPIRVRMGLHTGEVEERDGDYFGAAVNRAARIMAAGHGGQVLVSAATAAVTGATGLTDLGEHSFVGLPFPERVWQAGPGEFPPLRALGAVPSNLPADRSVFIGRERELGVVAGLVRSARVVTLTGVGGVGKTRLAVQAAAGMLGEFPDGVWLVELAPLVDAALVPTTVASAVGAPVSSGVASAEVVCRFLAQRRALVVLDNCEHVIDAAADLVDRVLGGAPRARVLATSREPLGVSGESVWRVPSLTVESVGWAGDAVALFVERAEHVRPGFALDDTTGDAVVAICRRLDGIPLAIELAAARSTVMSVEQIATRLDERFRLLTRGGRTAVPRQQTLQGAIDWSYELLAPAERDLFDFLGVFAGDFDLAAAAAVAGVGEFEALDLVEQLADKSMLEAEPARDRYRLLETLRQYGWDRLSASGRLGDARDAHAACFSTLAGEQAALMSASGRQVEALDRLEADYDNLRAALAYLIEERRAEDAMRTVRRLVGLFNIRHPREGFGWFQQVVAIADGLPPRSRARLLGDTAYAAMNAGDGQAQARYAQAAVDVGGGDAPAVAHWLLAMWSTSTGDYAAGAVHAKRAVAAAAAAGDQTTQVIASGGLIQTLAALGDEPEARRLIPGIIELSESLGNPTITGSSYLTIADALVVLGSRADAVVMLERALVHADAAGPIIAVDVRALYSLLLDDPREAARMVCVAIAIARDQLSGYHQLQPLMAAARILTQSGQAQLAARLLGTYRHQSDQPGRKGTIYAGRWYQPLVDQLTRDLGTDALDDAIRDGTQLSVTHALQLADEAIAGLS